MPSPCSGGGPAAPIPGAGTTTVVTAAAIESLFVLLGLEPLAAVLAPILAGVTFDLTTLCNNDPPADPTLVAADILALMNPVDVLAYATALGRLYQWFKHFYWYYACKCVTGATPAPPTPSNPGNPVSVNTGLPASTQQGTCWDTRQSMTVAAGVRLNLCNSLLPTTTPITITEFGPWGTTTTGATLPTGLLSITMFADFPDSSSSGGQQFYLHFYDATGAPVGGYTNLLRTPVDNTEFHTATVTPPGGAAAWGVFTVNGEAATHTYSLRLTFTCTGGQAFNPAGCCPPDPVLSAQVANILQMVTLLQRQVAPFSYVTSTVHSGLSGAGTIAIQGLLGCKVSVTTLPGHFGVEGTTPAEHFDLGWITFGTADGYPSSFRLEHNPQLLLPARCSAYTDLAYDLAAGVVVTITELVREP